MTIKKYVYNIGEEVKQIPVFRIAVNKGKYIFESGNYDTEEQAVQSVVSDFEAMPDLVNDWICEMGYDGVQALSPQDYVLSEKQKSEIWDEHFWKIV
jgi:hypothetical protein